MPWRTREVSGEPTEGAAARLVRYGLVLVFGSLIVAAFVSEAIEATETFGWVAYPLVFGVGCVCFLLSRLVSRAVASELDAARRRRDLEASSDD